MPRVGIFTAPTLKSCDFAFLRHFGLGLHWIASRWHCGGGSTGCRGSTGGHGGGERLLVHTARHEGCQKGHQRRDPSTGQDEAGSSQKRWGKLQMVQEFRWSNTILQRCFTVHSQCGHLKLSKTVVSQGKVGSNETPVNESACAARTNGSHLWGSGLCLVYVWFMSG